MSICRTLSFNALSHLIIHHLYTPTPPSLLERNTRLRRPLKTLTDRQRPSSKRTMIKCRTCCRHSSATLAFPLSLARAICVRCVITAVVISQISIAFAVILLFFFYKFRFGGKVCRRFGFGNNTLWAKLV